MKETLNLLSFKTIVLSIECDSSIYISLKKAFENSIKLNIKIASAQFS